MEFPDLIFKSQNLAKSINHLEKEANTEMVMHLISKAKQIFNFTHYLFEHSNKYVQLLLINQIYKRLNLHQLPKPFSNNPY